MKKIFYCFCCFHLYFLSFAQKAPNVVYIISDDQAWMNYGFMGHPHIRTPHLDKLAQESVLFERGYVPTALCRPSLATLANGRYAHQHGVTGNDPSPKYHQGNPALKKNQYHQLISYLTKFDTLPKLLSEQDYLSFQSGKWWEGSYQHGGFTHGMTKGYPNKGGRHGDAGLKIGRKGMQPIADFIDQAMNDKRPFFLWYGVFLPHTPHNPPKRILENYLAKDLPLPVAKYYANCEWFDETCGQLIELLENRKIRENTLIVYVTDNGWISRTDRTGFALRSKQSPNEGGIRTPILFSWPKGNLQSGRRSDTISSIDIFPTVLAATGSRMPEGLPGINLLAHLRGEQTINREGIFGETFAHDIADIENPEASLLFRWRIEGKWKLILTYDGETNRYAKVHPRTDKRPQLFNLLEDPTEKNNLAKDNPDIVASLAKKIHHWWSVRTRKVITEFIPSEKNLNSTIH